MLMNNGQFIPYGFWISPQAEIYTINNAFGHKKFIEQLLGKEFDSDIDADNVLFDDGWIRIVNTEQTLMVNYKCITCSQQLEAIKRIDKQLEKQGCYHLQYILDYGYDYHFFDNIDKMLRRIRQRLYIE